MPERLPDFDVAVFAGDIDSPMTNSIRWLARQRDGVLGGKPVIFVMGNHEVYRFDIDVEPEGAKAEAVKYGIHVLDMNAVAIDGVRFMGCTLWTDYALYDDPEGAKKAARLSMNDHRLVRKGARYMTPDDVAETHAKHRAWLAEELRAPFEGPTVVVTHHLPSASSVAPRWMGNPITPAFASDLDGLILETQPDLWIHGHTHDSSDYRIGKTRILCNPKGYGPREMGETFENIAAFNEALVVKVGN